MRAWLTSITFLGVLILPGIAVALETPKATTTATPPAVAMSDPPKEMPALNQTSLACPEAGQASLYIGLGAKKRIAPDQFENIALGCISFGETESLLSPDAMKALDDATNYLLRLDNVIRVYIDLPSTRLFKSSGEDRLYRKRAFAVKQYLINKGVYAYLEKNNAPLTVAKPDEIKKPGKKSASARKKATPEPMLRLVMSDDINGDPTRYRQPLTTGLQFLPLDSVYFATNKAILTAQSQQTLDSIAQYLLEQVSADRVIIFGHTDYVGSLKFNEGLGERRAHAVRDYLAKRGVAPALLFVTQRGERHPVDENWTTEGRQRNRHVEMQVLLRDNQQISSSR